MSILKKKTGRVCALVLWGIFCLPLSAAEPEYSAWNALLKKYVRSGERAGIKAHLVDYAALGRDPDWRKALGAIENFDVSKLAGKREKMAFWINAYNIAAVAKVLALQPTTSITAKGDGVWKAPAITVAGGTYSLDTIEHNLLRPMGDARIHFAIVCASLSCPDLRREAYTAAQLEAQLQQQTRSFLTNSTKGMRIEAGTVMLSPLFSWFAVDFDDLEKFLGRYGLRVPAGAKRAEIPYNWSLNQ